MPNSFSVDKDVLASPDVTKSDEDLNFVLSYIRLNAISSDHDSITPTWEGRCSLLPTKSPPIMQVGFLPYLPHPVTKHETVLLLCTIFFPPITRTGKSSSALR